MGTGKSEPLHGIGVLLTRAREQAADLFSELESLGARVFSVPAIRIEHLPHPPGLTEALGNVRSYDYLVFTSVNGVYSFLRHIGSSGLSLVDLPSALCVGPKTAEAWRRSGGVVKAVPGKFSAVDLAGVLGDDLYGVSFLILRPEHIETNLGELLRQRGARTDEVVLYRTVAGRDDAGVLNRLLGTGDLDVVFFSSPSAVYGTLSMAGGAEAVRDLLAICIGPTTAQAATDSGLENVTFPESYTSEGMVGTLLSRAEEIRDRR